MSPVEPNPRRRRGVSTYLVAVVHFGVVMAHFGDLPGFLSSECTFGDLSDFSTNGSHVTLLKEEAMPVERVAWL